MPTETLRWFIPVVSLGTGGRIKTAWSHGVNWWLFVGLKEERLYWNRVSVCYETVLCVQKEPGGGAASTVVGGAPRSYSG